MKPVRFGLAVGTSVALAAIAACGLDESGTAGDGGVDVVAIDVTSDGNVDGGPVGDGDAAQAFDVPDLGTGETESGLPCTCVPSPPGGYTVVEYVPNQRPSCTTGYASSKDFVENPTAAASTCTCTCATTPSTAPTCACGANPATFNISSGNGNCTDVTNESVVANVGSCYKTGQTLNPGGQKLNNMLAAPATTCTASGGACAAANKVATIPPPSAEQGRACTLSASTSACTGGTCIPTPSTPFGLCITDFTLAACPSAFPISHVVGNAIADTRACGPSACTTCTLNNAGTCGVPQLTLYSGDNNCGNGGSTAVLTADNSTCTNVGFGNGTTFDSAKYTITQSGGACGYVGTFGATGGLDVTSGIRVCCHP